MTNTFSKASVFIMSVNAPIPLADNAVFAAFQQSNLTRVGLKTRILCAFSKIADNNTTSQTLKINLTQCNWRHRFQVAPFWPLYTHPKCLDLQKGSLQNRFQKASLSMMKVAVFRHFGLDDWRKTPTKLRVMYLLPSHPFLLWCLQFLQSAKQNRLLIYALKRKLEPRQINAKWSKHQDCWEKHNSSEPSSR